MDTENETPPEVVATEPSAVENIVKNYVIASMAAALVPIPLIDLMALSGIQLKMLHSLSNHYGVEFSKDLGKSLIGSLVGGVLPTTGATLIASLAKGLPGVGTAAGMVSMSILGGAATYALGKVFIQHFESGGTFLNFNPDEVRDYFAEQLKEGRNVASELKSDAKKTAGK